MAVPEVNPNPVPTDDNQADPGQEPDGSQNGPQPSDGKEENVAGEVLPEDQVDKA